MNRLFVMEWVKANGEKVVNQLFTVDRVSHQLECLLEWGCTEIVIKQMLFEED